MCITGLRKLSLKHSYGPGYSALIDAGDAPEVVAGCKRKRRDCDTGCALRLESIAALSSATA